MIKIKINQVENLTLVPYIYLYLYRIICIYILHYTLIIACKSSHFFMNKKNYFFTIKKKKIYYSFAMQYLDLPQLH